MCHVPERGAFLLPQCVDHAIMMQKQGWFYTQYALYIFCFLKCKAAMKFESPPFCTKKAWLFLHKNWDGVLFEFQYPGDLGTRTLGACWAKRLASASLFFYLLTVIE